mmetsp:Transcript_41597/g.61010  ORF Transcript_41597/g.61010 Transcript_41597/m.61010 type:complete len:201 (+) Transcript_41597:525-1127(+)
MRIPTPPSSERSLTRSPPMLPLVWTSWPRPCTSRSLSFPWPSLSPRRTPCVLLSSETRRNTSANCTTRLASKARPPPTRWLSRRSWAKSTSSATCKSSGSCTATVSLVASASRSWSVTQPLACSPAWKPCSISRASPALRATSRLNSGDSAAMLPTIRKTSRSSSGSRCLPTPPTMTSRKSSVLLTARMKTPGPMIPRIA